MTFLNALKRTLRASGEELFSILLLALIGALLMFLILPIPLVMGGYATTADDLFRGRPVGLRRWARGAFASWRLWYGWGIVGGVTLFLLLFALEFYNQLGQLGRLLQGVILVMLYFWFAIQFYALPLMLLQEEGPWYRAYRHAALMTIAKPLETFLAVLLLTLLTILLLQFLPSLLLLFPAFTVLLATALLHAYLDIKAPGEETPVEKR